MAHRHRRASLAPLAAIGMHSQNPPRALSPDTLEVQNRLRLRMAAARIMAEQLEREYPSPVQTLIEMFAVLPPDHGQWQDVIAEPYG